MTSSGRFSVTVLHCLISLAALSCMTCSADVSCAQYPAVCPAGYERNPAPATSSASCNGVGYECNAIIHDCCQFLGICNNFAACHLKDDAQHTYENNQDAQTVSTTFEGIHHDCCQLVVSLLESSFASVAEKHVQTYPLVAAKSSVAIEADGSYLVRQHGVNQQRIGGDIAVKVRQEKSQLDGLDESASFEDESARVSKLVKSDGDVAAEQVLSAVGMLGKAKFGWSPIMNGGDNTIGSILLFFCLVLLIGTIIVCIFQNCGPGARQDSPPQQEPVYVMMPPEEQQQQNQQSQPGQPGMGQPTQPGQ